MQVIVRTRVGIGIDNSENTIGYIGLIFNITKCPPLSIQWFVKDSKVWNKGDSKVKNKIN